MQYDLTDSFLEAAYGLPKEIGRKVWKAIRMLSRDPDSPGLNLEKLHGKADGLCSFRVDQKYRTILLRRAQMMTLLFVGPEEDAYLRAERLLKGGPVAPAAGSAATYPKTPRAQAPSAKPAVAPPTKSVTLPKTPRVQELPAEPTVIPGAAKSRTGKYVPLARHLLNAAAAKQDVTLRFRQVEEILQTPLPPAARKFRPWWGNETSGHVQAAAWLAVGWRVGKVSLQDETVTFECEQ